MNGVEFYRKKNRLSHKELSRRTGISIQTIQKLEKHPNGMTPAGVYRKLSDELHVGIDELFLSFDPRLLEEGDRIDRKSRRPLGVNPVAVFVREKNLTFQQLGDRLQMTRMGASKVCRSPQIPEKHLSRLAKQEHLSIEEFLELYVPEKTS